MVEGELRRLVKQYLEPWLPTTELESRVELAVHQLESGLGRAAVQTPEGQIRFLLARDTLLIELPNGTKHVRKLAEIP